MSEENKALYRMFVDEIINMKCKDKLNAIDAPDFVNHDPMPGVPVGPDGTK